MDNNDILIRLRYALDIKDKDMLEIFKLGGLEYTREELQKILTKSKDEYGEDEVEVEVEETEDQIKCTHKMLDSFLNGLITYKRGRQDPKPGQPESPATPERNANNMLLKKLKVALQLTTEDMLEILDDGGIIVSKGELGAILRKEGHRNYKVCGDNFARKFLRGLATRYRK